MNQIIYEVRAAWLGQVLFLHHADALAYKREVQGILPIGSPDFKLVTIAPRMVLTTCPPPNQPQAELVIAS